MCADEMCQYNRNAYPDEFRRLRDPYDLPSEFDFRSEVSPVRKTRKIERHGKLCFSTRPILTCPSHTYPTGVKKTEEVTFKCQPKHSSYWGTYDSSSSSSSSSTEESADNTPQGNSGSTSSSSSDSSTDDSSEQTTRGGHTNTQRRTSSERQRLSSKTTRGEASSSNSESDSTSSSERIFDNASGEIDTFTQTIRIPESCRRL